MKKDRRDESVEGVKKRVEERGVIEKEVGEILMNGKKGMWMIEIEEFKRDSGSGLDGIFIGRGRRKRSVGREREKFGIFRMCGDIDGGRIGRMRRVN